MPFSESRVSCKPVKAVAECRSEAVRLIRSLRPGRGDTVTSITELIDLLEHTWSTVKGWYRGGNPFAPLGGGHFYIFLILNIIKRRGESDEPDYIYEWQVGPGAGSGYFCL